MVIKCLLVVLTLTYNFYPQLLKEEIYRVTPTENKISEIRHLSTAGSALIIETENNVQNYYLVNLLDKLDKKLLFSSQQVNQEAIRFSENNRFITFSTKEADRYVMKIYDTLDGTIKEISDPQGDVLYASLVNKKNILYEVNPPRDYPKIYLLTEDISNPKFIGDGTTPLWSPDGKWFLARKAEYDKSDLKNKRVKMLGYTIVKKPIYSIYNYQGQKILDIKNHDDINFIQWSPTSDKILFTELDDIGFYVVYLKFSNKKIEIEKEYHFEGFINKGKNVAGVNNPTWSPSGNWIAFEKSIEDGQSILESSIYIHNTNTHKQFEIINLQSEDINEIEWISDYELLTILDQDYKSHQKIVNKITIALLKND